MLLLTETGRRGRRRPHREAAQPRRRASGSTVEADARSSASRSRSASPAARAALLRIDALVRDADAAMYSAKSLGRNQTYIFAEPDEDARVPRAPISPAGRALAIEVGRIARDAATASLTSVISPLPHYRGQPSALIAVDRRRAWPATSTCPRARSTGSGSRRSSTTSARSPSRRRSSRSRRRSRRPSGGPSSSIPRIGQVILEQAAALKDAVPIILHHHERYSGHGYPFGLRGNDIPLGARIVAIADAYDAMTHDRPYKRAIEPRRRRSTSCAATPGRSSIPSS